MLETLTNGQILARHNLADSSIEHLDLPVPIISGPQAQGDVLILPCASRQSTGVVIAWAGITVVRGETTGGNAHILHALSGECRWEASPDAGDGLLQGWLTVSEDASATLVHTQEHSVLGIGPGCYELRRQREFAGEWRRVSD